jgi:hypothetical protein
MSQQHLIDGIAWFKKQFGVPIAAATAGTPYTLDFLTAIAVQESFEVWGRCFQTKPVADVLMLCVGDILDAPKRNVNAFPHDRAELLAHAPGGPQMFAIARQAFVDMAQVAVEYQKFLSNPNKFCHAFGIFQYDIQAFLTDPNYFLNKDWADFSKCLGKCIDELDVKKKKTFPAKQNNSFSDSDLVYVAIAYNCGRANLQKDFKQGFQDDVGHFYGENIDAFMKLSKATPPAP